MVSQQQKATKAQQGNEENGIQVKTPTKLSVPDDAVGTTSMNELEVDERGEIVPSTGEAPTTPSSTAPGKKRRKKKYRELLVDASEVMPRPSIWPLVLAFSIAFTLFGLIWNAVILFIGIILIVGSIIGWSLEKREHTYKSAVPVKKGDPRDTSVPAATTDGTENNESNSEK